MQAATGSEEAFDMGKKERARLRAQAKLKKQQLESLRVEQNADTALGEVRSTLCPTLGAVVHFQPQQ